MFLYQFLYVQSCAKPGFLLTKKNQKQDKCGMKEGEDNSCQYSVYLPAAQSSFFPLQIANPPTISISKFSILQTLQGVHLSPISPKDLCAYRKKENNFYLHVWLNLPTLDDLTVSIRYASFYTVLSLGTIFPLMYEIIKTGGFYRKLHRGCQKY